MIVFRLVWMDEDGTRRVEWFETEPLASARRRELMLLPEMHFCQCVYEVQPVTIIPTRKYVVKALNEFATREE